MLVFVLILITKVVFTSTAFYKVTGNNYSDNQNQINITTRSFDKGIKAKNFYSVLVDDNNIKWFLTEYGIVSFDDIKWSIYNNRKIPAKELKGFVYNFSSSEPAILIASPEGLTVASLPIGKKSNTINYNTGNTSILSNNTLGVAAGRGPISWIGTEKGISALLNGTWLTNAYQRKYRESMFQAYPITSMATTPSGDSLYIGTDGAGIARIYRDEADAVSGASEYAQWGPVDIPSDNVYSIFICPDGTQWFGTNMGVARHKGNVTLRNWTAFSTKEGLVNNFVQAIATDLNGNMWFGTQGGISCFDGSVWNSFTTDDGISSNNILCIAVDRNNIIWFGTDSGVTSYKDEKFTNYK
jgi:ligand-binding sensor domain-containing protein